MNTMTTTPHDQAKNQGWGVPQSSMLAQLKREQLPTDKHLVLFDKYKQSLEILRKEGYNAGYHTYPIALPADKPTWTADGNFVPDRVLLYDSRDHWQVEGFSPYFKEMSYTNIQLELSDTGLIVYPD